MAGPGLVVSKIKNRVAYSRSMSAGAVGVEREGLGGANEKGDGAVFTDDAAQDGAEQAKRGMGAGTQGEGRVGGGDLTELGAGAVGDDGGRGGEAGHVVAAGRGEIAGDNLGGDVVAAGVERIGSGVEEGAAGVAG